MTPTMIYVTAGSEQEALSIGRALVENRLAACANVLGAITSVYWWEGTVQEEGEAALFLKTRPELVEDAVARIKELHSYDCPCVVALPISEGNEDFFDWIIKETKQPTDIK